MTRYDAHDLLKLASCCPATSVERMAHRWYLEPGEADRPDMLLAPRFSRVPALRVDVPHPETPCEVHLTCWVPPGWFDHIRVSWPGAAYPVTVKNGPRIGSGRDTSDPLSPARLWSSYACTVPAGTPFIRLTKNEEVESCLVAVEFRPVDAMPDPVRRSRPHAAPVVAAIIDNWSILVPSMQAYDVAPLADFYKQMRDAGFSHAINQVYAGTSGWSEIAQPHKKVPFGHREFANFRECSYAVQDSVRELQRNIDQARAAGLKLVASFRINNEWLVDWARSYFKTDEGVYEWASEFSVRHPEFHMTYKTGDRYGAGLDFAFPEVREYRLALIEEWCEKFRDFDGICIDLYRHPPMVSYPEHLVQEFKDKTGIDVRTVEPLDQNTMIPEWLAFRAAPFTEFMRGVRRIVNERCGDDVEVSARVGAEFERAMVDGADLQTWFDEGLVDRLHLYHRDERATLDTDSRPVIEAGHAAGIEVVHHFEACQETTFGDAALSELRERLDIWRAWGSDGFSFYEGERQGWDGRYLKNLPGIVNAWTEGRA